MKFTYPESGHYKDFEIFYLSDYGQQKSVVRCEWSNAYECSTESGFNVTETDDKYALITLPGSLKQHPGKFHWQISGLLRNSLFCSWIPEEICKTSNDDLKLEDTGTTVMVTNSSLSRDLGSMSQDDNALIKIGAGIGVAVVISLLLIVGILLFRRHRKNKGFTNSKESKIFVDEERAVFKNTPVGSDVGDEENGRSAKIYTNRSKRSSGHRVINEKRPFLRNKEDSFTQKKSEHENKPNQGKFCDMDIEGTNNHKDIDDKISDEGFESKDSDESSESKDSDYDPENKSSVSDSDKKTNDDGYGEKQ